MGEIPRSIGKNIFREIEAGRATAPISPCRYVPGLDKPLPRKFADRKNQIDQERFHGAQEEALRQGVARYVESLKASQ